MFECCELFAQIPSFMIHFGFCAGSPGAVRHDVDGERHDHLPVSLAADGILPPRHIRRRLPDFRAGRGTIRCCFEVDYVLTGFGEIVFL